MTTWDDYLDRLEEEEYHDMEFVAEHLGCEIDDVVSYRPSVRENLRIVKLLQRRWIVKKPCNEEQYETVREIKRVELKKVSKKTGKNFEYGRIEITVPVEWVGYTTKVIVSKTVTPKLVFNRQEIKPSELKNLDTSNLATIVEEQDADAKNKEFMDKLVKAVMNREGITEKEAIEYLENRKKNY
jgi:hypothetical protein